MIRLWIPGLAAPGGSKKGFIIAGRVNIVDDCKRNGDWKAKVARVARESGRFPEPLEGPLLVTFSFVMPRPKGHYRTGKNAHLLRDSAPEYPTVKPDTTKLIRSTEDALKTIAWVDDSQIVEQRGRKRYGRRPGVWIEVEVIGKGA